MNMMFQLFLSFIAGIFIGGIIVFFLFKRYLEKNPPISERQIKEMFKQMGRTASEKQIKQIMSSMKNKK
ncbi:MAG: putative secreted protein [Candidatus Phytoplasma cynodontis]|uniref:YneF family protein n=1 Tax='Cynodon dactylon' phytoplasma TaxID=295320 RepID=UPI001265BE21|nr:YneF family protein ['Cynodon dactylon' phytoplasma]KAB8121892.1 YneF family protein ['Cynodon dactylon' phytoplasma]WIA07780.1 MAG: putative secreted protein [Candidatus Phytoplasma cynodontis]